MYITSPDVPAPAIVARTGSCFEDTKEPTYGIEFDMIVEGQVCTDCDDCDDTACCNCKVESSESIMSCSFIVTSLAIAPWIVVRESEASTTVSADTLMPRIVVPVDRIWYLKGVDVLVFRHSSIPRTYIISIIV